MLSANLRRISSVQSAVVVRKSLKSAIRTFSNVGEVTTPAENESYSPAAFRQEHQIVLKGDRAGEYDPMPNFASTPFLPELKKVLQKEGYSAPTAIQSQSWPIILDGRDIISVARTGSGKTIGFLLPAFQQLLLAKKNPVAQPATSTGAPVRRRLASKSPTVLVLAPTRELTVQIEKEAYKYCSAGVRSACLYGGSPKGPQVQALRDGVDVAICTPGRCNDLNIMGALDLSQIKYLVLDEADRMLDMGFEPQIREIVDQLPEGRQTIFFTATWPKEVQNLARSFLTNPIQINVGDGDQLNANKAITQKIVITNPRDKMDTLLDTLTEVLNGAKPRDCPKTLVFVARKVDADYVSDTLHAEGFTTEALHGDKTQQSRDRSMERFRNGNIKVLVATDVAARGLDVKDISTVVNYDFPNNVEDYVHRIGRTARGTNTGVAYTFLINKELANANMMGELHGVLERCNQEIPPELQNTNRRGGSGSRSAMGSSSKYGSATPSNRGGARGGGYQDRERSPSFGDSRGGRGGDSFGDRGGDRGGSRGGSSFGSSRGGSSGFGGGGGFGGRGGGDDDDFSGRRGATSSFNKSASYDDIAFGDDDYGGKSSKKHSKKDEFDW